MILDTRLVAVRNKYQGNKFCDFILYSRGARYKLFAFSSSYRYI